MFMLYILGMLFFLAFVVRIRRKKMFDPLYDCEHIQKGKTCANLDGIYCTPEFCKYYKKKDEKKDN